MDSQHPLLKWIEDNKTTQAELARAVDVSPAYISDILKWKKEPSLDLADRMSEATGRAVPIESFVRRTAEAAQ